MPLVHFMHIPEEESGTVRNFKIIFGYVRTFNDLGLRAWSMTEIRDGKNPEGMMKDIPPV